MEEVTEEAEKNRQMIEIFFIKQQKKREKISRETHRMNWRVWDKEANMNAFCSDKPNIDAVCFGKFLKNKICKYEIFSQIVWAFLLLLLVLVPSLSRNFIHSSLFFLLVAILSIFVYSSFQSFDLQLSSLHVFAGGEKSYTHTQINM